ncbi:MAG: sugar phosphate isomerase/epimerase [Phycisphaerales bacterium]|nr:sugar phosphate isomerase/epimerase [Phycisphaerales bacterium]
MSIPENPQCCVARIGAGDLSPPVDAIQRAGAIGVELVLPPDNDASFDNTRQLVTDACMRFNAVGLRLTALSLATDVSRDIGSPDPKVREAAAQHLIAMMDLASVMGARIVTITAGIVLADNGIAVNRYEDAYHFSVKTMIDLRFEAAAKCIRIACRLGSAGFLLSPIDSRMWIDQVNSPWVGGRLDPSVIAGHGSPADWIQTLGHRLFIVHCPEETSDGDPSNHQRLGRTELSRMLRAIGSDAIFSVDAGSTDLESMNALA